MTRSLLDVKRLDSDRKPKEREVRSGQLVASLILPAIKHPASQDKQPLKRRSSPPILRKLYNPSPYSASPTLPRVRRRLLLPVFPLRNEALRALSHTRDYSEK
jgi:hypothetical protein